jgi:uncharacterized phiE125 gp8 family phage protein
MSKETWRVTTGPVLEPVSLTEVKAQCRIDGTAEDTYLGTLITAAREYCEGIDWRAYLTQTIELWLEHWPHDDEIELPRPPLQSVTSIEYYDTSDVKYTMSPLDYYVDTVSTPGAVHLKYGKIWPTTALRDYNAICVTYKAGATAAANVPAVVKQAMLLLIGHWYENREATISGTVSRPIDFAVQALLGMNRVMEF